MAFVEAAVNLARVMVAVAAKIPFAARADIRCIEGKRLYGGRADIRCIEGNGLCGGRADTVDVSLCPGAELHSFCAAQERRQRGQEDL